MLFLKTIWCALTFNYLYLVNSIVFFFAATAILWRLYELTQLAYSGPKKIITSFFALCITALVVFVITMLVIASQDSLRWQLGFFIWLIYISAILIIFAVVEALFSFEPAEDRFSQVLPPQGGIFVGGGAVLFCSYFFDVCGLLLAVDFYSLILGLKEINTTFSFSLHAPFGDTNLFKQLRYGLGHTPKLFIMSGLLQGVCLAIVVKLLRIPPQKN